MWFQQNRQLRLKIPLPRYLLFFMNIQWVEKTHTTISHDPEVHNVSVQISFDRLDNQVRCLWEFDSIEIKAVQIKNKIVQEKEITAEFSKIYQTEDDCRVVSLPWKSTATTLPANMAKAKKKMF
ncbi:hypothetical protein TNCV_1964741 [Trichonephila clavipes]|nr:hypothetical protein TNCV_1964741 [Trichonephila clavipes]